MPFRSRRKRSFRKRPMGRPFRRRRRTSFKARMLRKNASHKPERKDASFQYGSQILPLTTTASAIFLVNGVPGILSGNTTGSNSRIGREVSGQSLSYQWFVQATSSQYVPRIQMKIYYDTEPDGGTPSGGDFKITDDIVGDRNLNFTDRFICLHTVEPRPFAIGQVGATNISSTFMAQGKVNLKGAVTRFLDSISNGSIASVASGAIWCVTYGTPDIQAVSTNSKLSMRYRFTDV